MNPIFYAFRILFLFRQFRKMMTELEENLEKGVCQNYWIPDINLFGELHSSQLVSKRAHFSVILKNPKKYVADEWLEYSRCIRKQCCYCGELLYLVSQVAEEVAGEGCSCCVCCRINCNYDDSSCCSSNQYKYDPLTLDVY